LTNNESLKWAGIACLLGCLSVGIIVAGIIIGFLITLLTPILIVFTGLWIWRVITAEPSEESDSGSEDSKDSGVD